MKESHVKVNASTSSYSITIGTGNLVSLPQQIATHAPTKVFILYDENVKVHLDLTLNAISQSSSMSDSDSLVETIEIPSGEKSKSVEQASRVWEFLTSKRADRQSLVVALGGGVVGDLAGFIAATFARGIRFFQVPTTLLAHVDSSVGGKTGINLSSAKNMVGSFWQPVEVLIDTRTLSTLDQREYLSGIAEVIKYGLIMDREFFEQLEDSVEGLVNRDDQLLIDVIAHCCRLKAQVVEEDEKETTGRRAILNYGHTFAHAFETVFGYGQYLHGEAVAVGMLCAGELARKLGLVDKSFCERQLNLIRRVGLPDSVANTDVDSLIEVMRRDKKNVDDVIRFILPEAIGKVSLMSAQVDRQLIADSMRPFMSDQ